MHTKKISFLIIILILFHIAGCAHKLTIPLAPLRIEYYEKQISFEKLTDRNYQPTNHREIYKYKNINHFTGMDDKIYINEKPSRPYEIIGIMKLKKDWYFDSTLDKLVDPKVRAFGGDAILKYQTFQSKAAVIKRQDTGEIENLYYMGIEATIIRFLD